MNRKILREKESWIRIWFHNSSINMKPFAGIVHIAETEDAAAEAVLQILKEARSKRVALGALADSFAGRNRDKGPAPA
jgi:hypothetical protein